MKYLLPLFCLGAIVGCSSDGLGPSTPGGITRRIPIEGFAQYALGEPITYGNLSLVPVLSVSLDQSGSQRLKEEYVTLAEAHKNGWVEIHEVPGDEEVSRLEVKNLGPKPLLLLAGELLLGGKQDRVVAKDTVVPAGEIKAVPVFCVEQGRWEGSSKQFEGEGGIVPQSVRQRATFEGQSDVWQEVAEFNTGAGASTTGTSVRLGVGSEKVKSRVESDLPRFRAAFEDKGDVVGVVCVLNDKIESLELFGNAKLLQASLPSLLRGFLAEAAVADDSRAARIDFASCSAFVAKALNGTRNQRSLEPSNSAWSVDGDGVQGREVFAHPSDSKANSKPLIHGSYSAKDD